VDQLSGVRSATPQWYHSSIEQDGRLQQHVPVSVEFSSPIYSLKVIGIGAYYCLGTFGTVTAFDELGSAVAEEDLAMSNPSDCGADNVTNAAEVTLTYSGPVYSVLIEPMSPWQFDVFGSTGNAKADYYFSGFLQPESLGVACLPNPSLRGSTISCDMTGVRNGQITGWTFTDNGTTPFTVQEGAVPMPTTWTGPVAIGGTVTLTATVGGVSQTATTSVVVNPRTTWAWYQMTGRPLNLWDPPDPVTGIRPLTYPPTASAPGTLTNSQMGLFTIKYGSADSLLNSPAVISSGPNFGWYFVARPLPSPLSWVNINQGLQSTDPFYLKQTGGGREPITRKQYCKKVDVDNYLTAALKHEGVNPSDPGKLSHYDVYQQDLAATNLNMKLEQTVGYIDQHPDASSFRDALTDSIFVFDSVISVRSRTVDSANPVNYSCYWRF
jgi:hypothetical protein